jgi:ABC-type multidrug transport system ATPase subunit
MLTLRNISKTYPGNIQALQDINLDIEVGMFGLLGPNGAGKSTLMRTVATLQEADSGTVEFNGSDISKDKIALRKVLGYLPQEFGAYPRTSAEAMLRHFAALKGLHGHRQKQVVESLLVQTNLWEVRKRSVDKFSGGMKQRYGIAQALLGNPELIIVDEPTAGLDPGERRRFQNLLAEIGKDRVVILSTHIVDDVSELCPEVAIMGNGRILRQGSTPALVNGLDGKIWTVITDKDNVPALRKRCKVISTRFRGGMMEVRVLAEAQPESFKAAAPELEDVYFSTLVEHGLTENLE